MKEAALNLHLLRLPGIGPVGLRKILTRLDSFDMSPAELFELPTERLIEDMKLTPEQVSALHHADFDPEADIHEFGEMGIRILSPEESVYPSEHLSILGRSRPTILFAMGNLDLLKYPMLGLSGSRKASEESLLQTSEFCERIASEDWVIVSGGARGADEAAHLAAVRRGPGTIVMLPTGILKPNIRGELRKHFDSDKTLLLSEFPPEQGWTNGSAMQRNRLIAALSQGLVLVEPGMKGGTFGTGRLAQKLGVPLYLLWSEETWGKGSEAFIRTGTQPISTAEMNTAEFITVVKFRHQESVRLRQYTINEDLFA